MKTFQLFEQGISVIPTTVGWYLSDMGEALGKQAQFTNQAPKNSMFLEETR